VTRIGSAGRRVNLQEIKSKTRPRWLSELAGCRSPKNRGSPMMAKKNNRSIGKKPSGDETEKNMPV